MSLTSRRGTPSVALLGTCLLSMGFHPAPPISSHFLWIMYGMASSSDSRMQGFEDFNSQKSSSSSNNSVVLELAQGLNPSQMSDIFRAAHQMSHNDRIEAVEVRKKNLCLISYIEAMGHCLQEVNNFLSSTGKKVTVNDDNIRSVSLVRPEVGSHVQPINDHVISSPGNSLVAMAGMIQDSKNGKACASTSMPDFLMGREARLGPVGNNPSSKGAHGPSSSLGLGLMGTGAADKEAAEASGQINLCM